MLINDKTDTKFKVTTIIRKFLLENETINLLVGKRIFPVLSIEEAGEGDFIVYQRDSYSQLKTKMGLYDQQVTVLISCVSTDYDTSQELAEQVYLALQDVCDYKDEETGIIINRIDLEDSAEDYGAGRFIQVLKFRVE